jgi:2-oxoacid:acceptor oxidoreductase gamma subunit (pyruvate/2-ketoisovalerate family)
MVEIRIHGRGGQGGVTLAKLIALSRFLQGRSVQAFGIYAAERSGAPIQAFCRYADEPITVRNLIYEPDHVVVLDPTLVGPAVAAGLAPGGWILVNTEQPPEALAAAFPLHRIATVDATAFALAHHLGTRSVPIVNTALAGAVARMLEIPLDEMLAALDHLGFGGGNVDAAREAFRAVLFAGPHTRAEREVSHPRPAPPPRTPSFLNGAGGAPPTVRTGQWATQQPHRQQWVPPCNHVCPAGNDVRGFLEALADERVDDALEILLRTSPFPSVCGRVCPAPCMASCNRAALDGSVNVRQLERFAGDQGMVTLPVAEIRAERVAVVGSGPAGLSAAYHLARFGYGVTVYEGAAELGGLLRSGIPGFRLPDDVVDRDIGRILELGVEAVTGHRIDRSRLLELTRSYDAVLVATGLQELQSLQLGAADGVAVIQGIDMLDRARRGLLELPGEDIVVVGGGNTAMDAARSALRLGAARVRVVYRRSREEMPAIAEEIDEALEEGVELHMLTQPVALAPTGADGEAGVADARRWTLTCRRMALGEPDASGRRRPEPVPGSEHALACSRVILALGQSPDLSVFPEGTEVREEGRLLGLLETPVLALGDLATAEGTVAGAIGSGRRAALHLHQTFTGQVVATGEATRVRSDVELWRDEVIREGALRLHLFERQAATHGAALLASERVSTFDEVHQGLVDASEARRCLSCGVCNECDLCVTFCPDGVLKRVGHELVFDYAYCKGCGVCVTECPRNVVFMSHL